jgi:hypothetical protein
VGVRLYKGQAIFVNYLFPNGANVGVQANPSKNTLGLGSPVWSYAGVGLYDLTFPTLLPWERLLPTVEQDSVTINTRWSALLIMFADTYRLRLWNSVGALTDGVGGVGIYVIIGTI